jgi:hypothetical protein
MLNALRRILCLSNSTTPINKDMPALMPGDIVLCGFHTSDSIAARVILWFERLKSYDGARVWHGAGMLSDRTLVEAVGAGVQLRLLDKYDDWPIVVYRHKKWSPELRERIATRWALAAAEPYAWDKIVLQALDALLPEGCYWFTRLFGVTNFKNCSALIGWGIDKETGQNSFALDWQCLTPDWLDDFMTVDTDNWLCIWDTVGKNRCRLPAPVQPRLVLRGIAAGCAALLLLTVGCATRHDGALLQLTTVVGLQVELNPQNSLPAVVRFGLIRTQYTRVSESNTCNVATWTDAEQRGWMSTRVHTGFAQWTGTAPPIVTPMPFGTGFTLSPLRLALHPDLPAE